MAVGTGYSKVASSGLVFAYDTGDTYNSYIGEPTTNICTGAPYSIYNSGATNVRNSTDIAPPVPGYEVVKVTADTLGSYGQCILWNAPYATNVMTATNSVYAYLTIGSYVQVGQHWWPWNYGSPIYIAKNQWIRISNTYTINEGNSYGSAAMVYSTDGIAYFSMPQYEIKTHMTPFVTFNGTRSTTQGLLDVSGGGNTVALANMSYDNNAMFYFDGTDDVVTLDNVNQYFSSGVAGVTTEAVFKITPGASGNDGPIFDNYRYNVWYNYSNDTINLYTRSGPPDTPGYQFAVGVTSTSSCRTKGLYNHLVTVYQTVGGVGTVTLYINGQAAGTATGTMMGNYPLTTARIGQSDHGGYGTYRLNGQVPVTKVYNRILTAAEVRDNYAHYKTRFNLP